ncbi:MAG: hypothetical protein ACW99U_12210 [Candidatus Thorarchaeota archaeon]|jgi:hypothetical protein
MGRVGDKKEFSNLGLHLWRIKDEQKEEWREEIYLMGSDDVLQTLIESWRGLLESYQTYGKGTRRYMSNPPEDFDHVAYGRQNRVQIKWMDSLVLRISPEARDEETYSIENKVVVVHVNPNTMNQFIKGAQAQLDTSKRYGHGSAAACGLWFSPDWLGAE